VGSLYGKGGGGGRSVCLLSSFLLLGMRYVRYVMVFRCIFSHESFNEVLGMLRSLDFFIKCSCVTPLTLAMMVMRGFTFHLLFLRVFISESHLVCFMSKGLLWVSIMAICKFYELEGV
jgi:hypothetical protein